jgi:hypothetical protein
MSFAPNDGFYDQICTECNHERRWHCADNNYNNPRGQKCLKDECLQFVFSNLDYVEFEAKRRGLWESLK